MLIYYVYAYLRKDGSPYYIGKGKGDRAYDRINHNVTVPHKSRIIFLERNLSEIGALAIERRMIKWYGRKDLGTGVLRNKTDGGDGTAGHVLTKEHKEKIRDFNIGKTVSENTKKKISEKLTGVKHTPERNLAKSIRQKGKARPEEYKEKMRGRKYPTISEKLKGVKKTVVECPHCNKSGGVGAMGRWHFTNCSSYVRLEK